MVVFRNSLKHTVNNDNGQACVYGLRVTEKIELQVENSHDENLTVTLYMYICIGSVRITYLQTSQLFTNCDE